jgi:hypothetical protein
VRRQLKEQMMTSVFVPQQASQGPRCGHKVTDCHSLEAQLTGTVSRDFRPLVFSSNNPIKAPDSCCKIFSNFVANSPRYKRIRVVLRYAGIALDHDPALAA